MCLVVTWYSQLVCVQLGSRTGPAHCRKSEAKKLRELGGKSILWQRATMDEETVNGITSRSATDTESESDGSDVVFVGISSTRATAKDRPSVVKRDTTRRSRLSWIEGKPNPNPNPNPKLLELG